MLITKTLFLVTVALVGLVKGNPVHVDKRATLPKNAFNYGTTKVRGVNIGGWLVLEPWITPSMFQQFVGSSNPAVDEYTFCQILGQTAAQAQLEAHWTSWVNETDIINIANANLNHIRIPIGYWAIDLRAGEPYVKSTQIQHLQQVVTWAGNHGLKVIVDVHGVPGSQNGYDNSGHRGPANWMVGSAAGDNVGRSRYVVQQLSTMFNVPQYWGIVTAIELVNEPASYMSSVPIGQVQQYYKDAYEVVRYPNFWNNDTNTITGTVAVIHDAFQSLSSWNGFMLPPTYQNVVLDTHIYKVFNIGQLQQSQQQHIDDTCANDGPNVGNSNSNLWTIVGEWSLATTDCAKWLNGFGNGARWDSSFGGGPAVSGASCNNEPGNGNWQTWSSSYKAFLRTWAEKQISAYERGSGWVFWNFKTESAPQWNYILGVQQGWIPPNPASLTQGC